MKIPVILTALCLFAACKPVNFAARNQLSIEERANAVATLHRNAAAYSSGDLKALRSTLDEESPDLESAMEQAEAQIAQFEPNIGVRGARVVSESPRKVVIRYEGTIEFRRTGKQSVMDAESILLRTKTGWAIASTRFLSLPR